MNSKVVLYSLWSVLGSVASSITIPMLGDGSISWAEFRFAWIKLILGAGLALTATLKAFYSEPDASNPQEPPADSMVAHTVNR